MAKIQFSLRELLGVVLFVALGITALRIGGIVGGVVQFAFLASVIWSLVVAAMARKRLQAFAVGFAISSIVYIGVLAYFGKGENDPYNAKLPTTRCLAPAYEKLVKRIWIDVMTGAERPDYDPAKSTDHMGYMGGGMGGMIGGGMPGGGGVAMAKVTQSVSVDQAAFLAIGHVLWAFIFGYLGGKLAVFVYQRRDAA